MSSSPATNDPDDFDRRLRLAIIEDRERRTTQRWTRAGIVAVCCGTLLTLALAVIALLTLLGR